MQLKLLWELQQLDLAILSFIKKIDEAPWYSGVGELKGKLIELRNDLTEIGKALDDNRKQLRQLEMKVQKIVDDRKVLSDELYGGKVSNVKELEQMQRKLELLTVEQQKNEDKILFLMETVEEWETKLAILEQEIMETDKELQNKEQQLSYDFEEFEKELSLLRSERETLVRQIDNKYLNKYKILAEKNQGRALARVVDGICSGCRVFISSGLGGHLYNPDAMVYCENCGRLNRTNKMLFLRTF